MTAFPEQTPAPLRAQLRDATEADLPAIVEIYNSTIPSRLVTANTTPVTIESRRPWFHEHNPRTRPLWVAEIFGQNQIQSGSGRPDRFPDFSGDSQTPRLQMPNTKAVGTPASTIAGWLSLNSFLNGRPAYAATAEISLYVAEKYRRSGLGAWLLAEAIARAPACGITTLIANIFGHNDPSLRLFKKYGFETWGYLPRVAVLDGIPRDLAILGKGLKG